MWFTRDMGMQIFLCSAAYLLGYKDVWEHSYSFAVFPLFWLYEARAVPVKLLLTVAIIIAVPTAFVFYDVPLPSGPVDPEHHWNAAVSLLHHATKSLPLLFLYVSVVVTTLRRRSATSQSAFVTPGV